MRNGASRYFTLSFYIAPPKKDIAFESGRHRRTPTVFWFRRTAHPTLSTAKAVLALYFFTCG